MKFFLFFLLVHLERLILKREDRYLISYAFNENNPKNRSERLKSFSFRFPQLEKIIVELPLFSTKVCKGEDNFIRDCDFIGGFISRTIIEELEKDCFFILQMNFINLEEPVQSEKFYLYTYEKLGNKFIVESGVENGLLPYSSSFLADFMARFKTEISLKPLKKLIRRISSDTNIKRHRLRFFKNRKQIIACLNALKAHKESMNVLEINELLATLRGVVNEKLVRNFNWANPLTTFVADKYEMSLLASDLFKILSPIFKSVSSFNSYPLDFKMIVKEHKFMIERFLTFFVVNLVPLKDVKVFLYDTNYIQIHKNFSYTIFRNYIMIKHDEIKQYMGYFLLINIGKHYSRFFKIDAQCFDE